MFTSLIAPIFAMFLLTFLFSVYMLIVRIREVNKGRISLKYFKTYQEGASEAIIKTSRHYNNLFELPVLFYATCLLALHLEMQTFLIIFFAWFFVIARLVHMIIHVGKNPLLPRMLSFLVGWLVLIGMWVEMLFFI